MQYAFSGLLLQTVLYQDKPGTNSQNHRIITKMDYDDLGRLLNVKKSVLSNINGNQITKPEIEIVKNEYDALGRLKTKTIGKKIDDNGNYTTTPVETMEYDYNIRGWTLGMNRTYAKTTGSSSNYFGFDLGYDKQDIKNGSGSSIGSFSAAAFNGNITGMLWKGVGDGKLRKYDFTYDAVNRLTGADFKEHTGSQFSLNDIDFSVSNLSYDANGNILTMQQKGWKITGSTAIDDLRYHYRLNGTSNQLQNVIDMNNDVNTKLGDFRTSLNHTQLADKSSYVASPGSVNAYNITDYVYDANGNMIKDYNKDIGSSSNSGITYNYLNLPQTILLRNSNGSVKGAVDYVYNAAGIKLKKIVTDYQSNKTITTTTNYLNGFVYESRSFVQNSQTTVEYTDVLQFVPQEEGRIRFEKATTATCTAKPDRLLYDYFITDHLGNVRMVLTEQNESICYIAATIEDARRTAESQIYDIQTAQVTGIGQVNGASSYSQFEQQLYKVHGGVSGQKTGLGMVLKVMAGDVVKITGESIYDLPSGEAGSPATLALTELLTSFIGASPLAGKGITTTNISNAQGSGTGLLDFISNNPAPSNRAKAFINWILFDEQFKFVAGDVDPVNDNGGYKLHSKFINNPVVAGKSGYLYVYVSNESNFPVFFDNLVMTHTPGAVLEETGYYPWGLVMGGVNSKALTFAFVNKYKYNKGSELQDKEFSDGSGLDLYATPLRSLDPQLGRWWQIDSKPDYGQSLYLAMSNNPILFNDPYGDTAIVFGMDGNFKRFQNDGKAAFSGKIVTGTSTSITVGVNGEAIITARINTKSFKLNDGKLIAQAVKNSVIKKVEFITDKKIQAQIDRSGVKTAEAQASPLSYAKANSTASGAMDYGIQGYGAGDINKNTLYVTNGVGYDIADFGNFLWGRGMGELGISLPMVQGGAQYNHIMNSRRGHDQTEIYDLGPGTYGKPGWLDAQADQTAIGNGFWSSPRVIRDSEEARKQFSRIMNSWRPYQ